jgi:MFS family permease
VPDRFGPKRVLYPAVVLLASGFLVLSAAESAAAVVLAGAVSGTGHGFAVPILYTLVVERSTEVELGTAMAIFTGFFDLGALVGGPTLGWVIEISGYTVMFGSAAVVLLAGVAVFARWDGGARRWFPAKPDRPCHPTDV